MLKRMMKRIFFLLFVIACLFTITYSCQKQEVEIVPTPEVEETLEVILDPFYSSINENSSLEDYWNLFVEDAIRSGKPDPGYERTVNVFFGTEPDFASGVTADHAGRAYDVCNDETVSFEEITDVSAPEEDS